MHNILYIHGFNSSGNSNTVCNLRAMFPEYNVYSDDFDLLDLDGTQDKMHQLMKKYRINVLIGSSFGAFHVLLHDTNETKIVINPCMYPSVEIPKLDPSLSEDAIAAMQEYESRYKPAPYKIFGIFGKDDELFSYRTEFQRLYGYTNNKSDNTVMIDGHHRLSPDELRSGIIPAFSFLGL
ncbi:MAG: hypothetical protein IKQ61_11105 [Spirochaetales bacterium]|nr:hypothetical protein [Spirochaetales bacterium]MBR6061045.1 hypothetical protein [Spirochaetales bacterium]MBR6200793.1 hypothetical protein [Spirochaetales bacterium]